MEGRLMMVMTGLAAGVWHVGVSSLAMVQATETVPVGNGHLVETFIVIAGIALLVQALVIVALVLGLLKALKAVTAYAAEIKPKVIPIIEKTNDIIGTVKVGAAELQPKITAITGKVNDIIGTVRSTAAEVSPKITEITGKVGVIVGHGAEISAMAKDKVAEFGPTVDKVKETINTANEAVMDATHKTQERLEQLNQVVTESIEATVKAGESLRQTVTAPGRYVGSAVTGVKAAVMNFFAKKPKPVAAPRPAYRAAYRSNPAVPTHPGTAGKVQEPIDISAHGTT